MLVYWIVFFLAAALAIAPLRVSSFGWTLIGFGLIAFVGLRYQVGGDWGNYIGYLFRVSGEPFYKILAFKDPGYQVVNWIAANVGFDVWFVNVVAATSFVFGLIQFSRAMPDSKIALAAAVPYMVIVMAMGYTRQAMAFGFVLWGLTFLLRQKYVGFVILLAIGATFHKSAVILIPLAVLAQTNNRTWSTIWVGTLGAVLFMLLVQEHLDTLYSLYVTSDYSDASEGGPVRVAMNAVPALLFLVMRERLVIDPQERALWFWMSLLALCCLPLLAVSATAVDRVALYLMPIQLVMASYFPLFFRANSRVFARVAVLGLYGAIMFVWLNYAGHREAWLPYRFWPLA